MDELLWLRRTRNVQHKQDADRHAHELVDDCAINCAGLVAKLLGADAKRRLTPEGLEISIM